MTSAKHRRDMYLVGLPLRAIRLPEAASQSVAHSTTTFLEKYCVLD